MQVESHMAYGKYDMVKGYVSPTYLGKRNYFLRVPLSLFVALDKIINITVRWHFHYTSKSP